MKMLTLFFVYSGLWAQAAQPVPAPQSTSTPASTSAPALTPAPVAAPGPCLIVKHKGTVGRRLIWTALVGVPIAPGSKYDYVDSINYTNTKMAYKGKEIEAIQKQGVHVSVLNNKYTPAELGSARQACQGAPATDAKK